MGPMNLVFRGKLIWYCGMQDGGHFVPASMCNVCCSGTGEKYIKMIKTSPNVNVLPIKIYWWFHNRKGCHNHHTCAKIQWNCMNWRILLSETDRSVTWANLSLANSEFANSTTSGAASDDKFPGVSTFPFQWVSVSRRTIFDIVT